MNGIFARILLLTASNTAAVSRGEFMNFLFIGAAFILIRFFEKRSWAARENLNAFKATETE
jgi:hypothetical protein